MNHTISNQRNPYNQALKTQQDELVIQYLPAVRAMAYRLRERLPASVDVHDLISIGTEEMIKLSRRYNKDQNDSFWGYGKKRVYGAMLDFLRSLDTISRSSRRLVKLVDQEITVYIAEHGMEPDNAYLAKKLGEDIEKIAEARNSAMITSVMSLSEQLTIFSSEDVAQKVEKDRILEIVRSILLTFDERDQLIIQLYYFEELNLKEISAVLEISESRISQIHKKLLAKIKEQLGIRYG